MSWLWIWLLDVVYSVYSCYTPKTDYREYNGSSSSHTRNFNFSFCSFGFFIFVFVFCCFAFLVVLSKVLPAKISWNQHIDFCTFCRRSDTGAWLRERPQRLDTIRRRRCWRVYLVSVFCSIAVSVFCCIFVLPSIEISLSPPVRTCLLTVSFRLKGKTVAKMPKTCANAPATPRPCRTSCDYRLYIRYRVNAEFTLPISLTFAFDSVKRNLFVCIRLLLFLFGFSLSSFAFVLSRILCSRRHIHPSL